jgi:hypothetical protein
MMLAAWRGREAPASELIEATLQEASARGGLVNLATYASSVLCKPEPRSTATATSGSS